MSSWIHTGFQSSASGSGASAVADLGGLVVGLAVVALASGTNTLVDGPADLEPGSIALIARAVAS